MIGESPWYLFSHMMVNDVLESVVTIQGLSGLSGEPTGEKKKKCDQVWHG